jgi:acetyl-CoA carboxylase, biotin carboxylase subunit
MKRDINRVLIANRGEIAVRIAHTLREMGISPVTVHSDIDTHALHVRACDAAVNIGPAPSRESYLVIEKILAAAKTLGAQAIHPGYGFLSEKAEFSAACAEAGIIFIGPPAQAIESMGSKTGGRARMKAAGVPITPGTDGPVSGSDENIAKLALGIGYPIMLKAVSGGGGKGMRLVREESELISALRLARSEAKNAFGDDSVYLERFIERPRHVEIQVLCDAHGNGVYYGERDCSIQRRNQKIIEEAPSSALTPELRQKMGEVAVKGALSVGYVGAGTMEFLLDPKGHFYFLEMNTRLQVEHPVTESIFGVDLVREQVRIARGEPLGYDQNHIKARGHALEVRVYAEDPKRNFMPSPGFLTSLQMPMGPGVRVDLGVSAQAEVPIFYDPMIAKITVWAENRSYAIARMRRALRDTHVGGIKSNIAYLDALLSHASFEAGAIHTGFIEEHGAELDAPPSKQAVEDAIIGAVLHKHRKGQAFTPTAVPTGTDSPWRRAGRQAALLREGWKS